MSSKPAQRSSHTHPKGATDASKVKATRGSWEEKSKEVKRDSTPQSSGTEAFTDLFWHLANVHEEVRVRATTSLVETLVQLEKTGQRKASTKNGLTNSTEELDYALARLCKGLLSSRDAARPGFSTALTEVRHF